MHSFLSRLFLIVGFFFVSATAQAATLSLGSGSASVGQTLSIPVYVSAEAGESLNGVSARIDYPTDKLSLLSLSKAGSIITFWAEEPNYSNAAGTASIEGIIPNPGFSGRSGRVITLVFQVKAPGTATVSFGSAAVLANDGKGTNILTSASSRSLTLTSAATPTPAPVPAPAPKPERPAPTRPSGSSQGSARIPTTVSTSSASTSLATTSIPVVGQSIFHNPPAKLAVQLGRIFVIGFAVIGLAALALAAYLVLAPLIRRERGRRRASRDLVHRSFTLLKKDLLAHTKTLRHKPATALSEAEIRFLDQFEQDLEEVEKIVVSRLK